MSVQADRMGTVADNIANINTTGYKRAETEFSTLVPESRLVQYTPGSVYTHIRRGISEQGELTYTRSATDLAINGGGFFMVQGPTGAPYLTRAGSFVPNSEGELVNAAGYKLLGYNLLNGDLSSVINSAAGLEVVGTASLGMKAVPSRNATFQVNLPDSADVTAAASLPSANSASAAYSGKSSLVSYDNLGNEVILDVYTSRSAANDWEVTVYNRADASATGGFPYSAAPLATQTISFDPSNGQMLSSSATTLTVNVPKGQTLTIDMKNSTQLASSYKVLDGQVDGNPPADVDHLEISKEGVVTAVYEDGSRVDAYKIPLASVPSPDLMTALSGNVFAPSNESGDLLLGVANAGANGSIISGALEKPTVDLATELTTMVEAQRSYTANSKVFQTGAELLDVLVNLKR